MKAFPQDSDGRFMDLRDYFANQSIPIAYKHWHDYYFSESNAGERDYLHFELYQYVDEIAELSYLMADAMLKLREDQ